MVLLAVLCLGLGGAAAKDVSVDELVERLQVAHAGLDTLQAEFTQSLNSLALAAPQRESGTLYLRRPDQVRWEYVQPEEKLAVVDGERTWLYVPAEGQVFMGSLAEMESGGALGLLLGERLDLRREFRVELVLDDAGKPLADALGLTPREPSEEFERVEVLLGRDGLPRRIVVHGALGDVMEYRLNKIRTGMALDESLFRFRPPEGVDVVPVE
jgi:outer membrane lipoprotein carrier protein